MTEATKAQPLVLQRIEGAQRRASRSFRLQFASVWIAILMLIGVALLATRNVDTGWITQWAPYILDGAWLTILISVVSIVLAVVFALVGAIGRMSRNAVAHAVATFYVSFVRGTPLLVQIYFIYFSLPSLGIILPAIQAGIFALAFNYGAYMTEVFRAGIQAVPRGQREAAEALGMPSRLVMRRIVLPQATRIVIPAIGNEFIAMIKDSALVSIIGVQEVLWRAETSGRPRLNTLEAFVIAATIYWLLTILFSTFQDRLERRMARGDR